MVPTPQDQQRVDDVASRDTVVISGMAGLYPNAHNVKELADILYNKTNPVSKEGVRYQFDHPETPRYAGAVPELELFDAQFFNVHYHLGIMMDPMSRKLLEQVYQAIFDAGIRPEILCNTKKVGVFLGSTNCESEKFSTCCRRSKVGLIGSSKAMFSNRISYWLNARGPSVTVDGACCGSLVALEMAHQALLRGECEAAVVAGSKLWLHPHSSIAYGFMTPPCRDGKTKSFDDNASGPAFSEAINVLFLQKAKDALRVYAELVHVKCEFDTLQKGEEDLKFSFHRETHNLCNFLKTFYKEANMSPLNVDYVEAFGSADRNADKMELEVINAVYCEGRNKPLPVGSVTSNIGYTETASGIAAITKVLLGYHTGALAANLHLETPRSDVACLQEGRIQLLQEHHPFREGYAAVNGISITGLNAHVLLYNHCKPKNLRQYKTDIPYLVTISGRHESAVKKIIDDIKSRPVDPEYLALLHNIHVVNTTFHMGRGFAIIGTDSEEQTVCFREQAGYYDEARPPLWFVYSGMGSQWAGMGKHLMHIPVFAAAMHKCNKVLEPKGIDIIDIITSKDNGLLENILNSFVGIAAVQIGLTDILNELGLIPDKLIGHSVGELGCAYADGCLTAEEMILAAYYRGLVSLQTPLIRGAMAAVGLGYQQILKLCPPDIEVACHNSSESCSISGPANSIKEFTEKLTREGIFTKKVDTSNIAYHSKYIADAGPGLLKYLQEVIKTSKVRSERWMSTSVPRHAWGEPGAKYGGAEYLTNNLLNPVLFEETSQLIPAKAVLIEIAPHGLLQAILTRSLPKSCVNIPLTRRGNTKLVFFLEAIGRIYMQGFALNLTPLYPKVPFPVSTGTPMLSHLVEWAHEETWGWPRYAGDETRIGAACKFILSIHDHDHEYLRGHVLGERNLYPLSAVLMDVWDTLAMYCDLSKRAFSVQFMDVRVLALPVLHERRQLRLAVTLQRASGRFEVLDDVTKVATGYIVARKTNDALHDLKVNNNKTDEFNVTSEDIYELAFNRDHRYRGDFRSIQSATSCLSKARVLWRDNWVTFINAIFQLDALRQPHKNVLQPVFVKKINVDVDTQRKDVTEGIEENILTAHVFAETNFISCGGVSLENIYYDDFPQLKMDTILLKTKTATIDELAAGVVCPSRRSSPSADCTVLVESDFAVDTEQEVEVTVHYAGLNCLKSETNTEALPQDTSVLANMEEIDFSGKLNKFACCLLHLSECFSGVRVMGVAEKCASALWRARAQLLWPAPTHWGLQDAATVPRAYCLAYYYLVLRQKLLPGMSIYVEDGLSAFGQAVMSIALSMDCEVFTSIGTAHEKRFLIALFPKLKADHICGFDDFTDVILTVTHGSGCHFVISSPKGALMTDALRCAKHCGITIVTTCGKDITFGMFHLFNARNVIFLNPSLLQNQNLDILKQLQRLVAEGIASGVVRPLTRVPQRLACVARCAATARPPGSVLLPFRSDESNDSNLSCSPDKIQIIVCANEAFGILLAGKLVQAGARLLHIHSPKKIHYNAETWKLWFNQDVRVHNSSGKDLSKQSNVHMLLTECGGAVDVEGIHVIMLEETHKQSNDDISLTIHNLDMTSRELCTHLKYFTVLSDDGVGQSTCVSRREKRFPATKLELCSVYKINSQDLISKEAFTRWEVVEALEEAVISQEAVLVAKKQLKPAPSVLTDIEQVMNVSLTQCTSSSRSLAELGLSDAPARMATARVRRVHGIALDASELPTLTVKRLQEIDEVLYKTEYEETKGLDSFFSYVDFDEIHATTDMVFPTTLIVRDKGIHEITVKEPHLVVVSGMEGAAARFERLCERLQLAALVFQPGLARATESATEQALRYVQMLITKMELPGNFYLLGYETGVEVALEMARLLEENGLTGTVFCVGGGPQTISAEVEEVAARLGSGEALQEAVVRHMAQLLVGEGADRAALDTALDAALSGNDAWERQVELSARALLGRAAHSAQYVQQVMSAALARLQRARRATVRPRALRSRLLALLPADCPATARAELQRFSQQPVLAYQLRAPLASAADDLRCASVVNRHLSEDIRQRFKLMNRCDRYYIQEQSYCFQ